MWLEYIIQQAATFTAARWSLMAANKCVQPFGGLINLHFLFETVINHYPPDHCRVLTEMLGPYGVHSWVFREFFKLNDSERSSLMWNGTCDVSRKCKSVLPVIWVMLVAWQQPPMRHALLLHLACSLCSSSPVLDCLNNLFLPFLKSSFTRFWQMEKHFSGQVWKD